MEKQIYFFCNIKMLIQTRTSPDMGSRVARCNSSESYLCRITAFSCKKALYLLSTIFSLWLGSFFQKEGRFVGLLEVREREKEEQNFL